MTRRGRRGTMTTTHDNSTLNHPREQLLAGWTRGAVTTARTAETRPIRRDTHPPLACSRGFFFLIISFVAPHPLAMRARGQYLIVVGS
jgi:hypothetical protein